MKSQNKSAKYSCGAKRYALENEFSSAGCSRSDYSFYQNAGLSRSDCKFDAVAAMALGQIQSCIGLGQEPGKILGLVATELRHAKARGHLRFTGSKSKLFRFELFADALDSQHGALFIRVRENNQELFSANASANVTEPGVGLDNSRESLEDGITGFVTEGVVDRFEVIEVSHDDPKIKTVPVRSTDLTHGPIFNGAAVRQAGERIGESQLF